MHTFAEQMFIGDEAYQRQAFMQPFYQGRSVSLMQYQLDDTVPGRVSRLSFEVANTVSSLDGDLRRDVMHQIARSVKVVHAGLSHFELVVLDAINGGKNAPVMLSASTYSSSTDNPGNVSEIADNAILYPNHRIAYAASPGNGGSSPIPNQDGQIGHIRKTGRYTREKNGRTEAVPYIQDLHRALAKSGVEEVDLCGSDAAGGTIVTALAVELEPGQIRQAALSERSGFVDLSRGQIIGGIVVREQFAHAFANRRLSPDPERMTPARAKEAAEIMEVHQDLPNRQELAVSRTKPAAKLKSMWLAEEALRKGNSGDVNPLKFDTDAMLRRHPDMQLSYLMALDDPLYVSPGVCYTSGRQFLENLDPTTARVRTVFVPGTHAWNTHYPQFYHSVKQRVLNYVY
jgi:hypothetical protein